MIAVSIKDGEELVNLILGKGADVNQTSRAHLDSLELSFKNLNLYLRLQWTGMHFQNRLALGY
jgi:hypothetical protein